MMINFPLMGFNVSGGIRIIINIANGLAQKGHSISFIVPDYATTPPYKLATDVDVKIVRTHGAGIWRILRKGSGSRRAN